MGKVFCNFESYDLDNRKKQFYKRSQRRVQHGWISYTKLKGKNTRKIIKKNGGQTIEGMRQEEVEQSAVGEKD